MYLCRKAKSAESNEEVAHFALVVIAAAIGIIIANTGDASTYVSFDQAYQMASTGNNTDIHVVGDLKKMPTVTLLALKKVPTSFLSPLF